MQTEKDNGSENVPRMMQAGKEHTQCYKVLCGAALGAAAMLHVSPGHAEAASGLEGIYEQLFLGKPDGKPDRVWRQKIEGEIVFPSIDDKLRPETKKSQAGEAFLLDICWTRYHTIFFTG